MRVNSGYVRAMVAVIGGVLLSFVLIAALGAFLVRTVEMQAVFSAMRQSQSGRDLPPGGASAVFAAMDVVDFRMRWMEACIAALVGVFVGLVGKDRVTALGVLAALPFAFLFSGPWSSSSGVTSAMLYATTAGFAAWLVSKSTRRLAIQGRKTLGVG